MSTVDDRHGDNAEPAHTAAAEEPAPPPAQRPSRPTTKATLIVKAIQDSRLMLSNMPVSVRPIFDSSTETLLRKFDDIRLECYDPSTSQYQEYKLRDKGLV